MKTSRKNFERIMEGLNEAVAHARGEDVPGMRVHIPAASGVRSETGTERRIVAALDNPPQSSEA